MGSVSAWTLDGFSNFRSLYSAYRGRGLSQCALPTGSPACSPPPTCLQQLRTQAKVLKARGAAVYRVGRQHLRPNLHRALIPQLPSFYGQVRSIRALVRCKARWAHKQSEECQQRSGDSVQNQTGGRGDAPATSVLARASDRSSTTPCGIELEALAMACSLSWVPGFTSSKPGGGVTPRTREDAMRRSYIFIKWNRIKYIQDLNLK